MYVHCHSCDWEQDDFYSPDGYNPASYLKQWNKQLFSDEIDEQFTDDAQFVKGSGKISLREVIAKLYESYALKIRSMKWITYKDFKNDPKKACPNCGSENLDID
jgi:hypothetical protein